LIMRHLRKMRTFYVVKWHFLRSFPMVLTLGVAPSFYAAITRTVSRHLRSSPRWVKRPYWPEQTRCRATVEPRNRPSGGLASQLLMPPFIVFTESKETK